MMVETNEERQNNEFTALQSIYGEDVQDNRNQAWKVWRPLDLLFTLHPLQSSIAQDVHCSVTLRFQCCQNYPNKPPMIYIYKVKGLSDENATILLGELNKMAVTMCGEVMIFELAQHVQQFLSDHNKPTLSFYDEMLKQKTEMEKLKLQDLQMKENEDRQRTKEEIQRREEMLRSDRQRGRNSVSQESDSVEAPPDSPELVYYADTKMSPTKKPSRTRNAEAICTCNTKSAQVLRVTAKNNKKVYIGNCLGHSINGSTTYLAIDEESGDRFIAKKWVMPPAQDFQLYDRQKTAIQNDLKAICRLKQPSLVPYTAMEMCKENTKRVPRLCVYIFRDFVLGCSLKHFKSEMSKFSSRLEVLKFLRHIALGVFSALRELHSVGVLHMDVRSETVFLDESGAVKLVGGGLEFRLVDMQDGDSYSEVHTKTHDIYATAQLLLSLVMPDNDMKEIPPDLPGVAKDFFSRCITDEEESIWSAEQLLEHTFLVDSPSKMPRSKKKDECSGSEEDDDELKKIHHISPPASGHSRLYREFDVLSFLGKGAFGDVVKVKNKLDGRCYAIKRVQLNPDSAQLFQKITREVKLLSRLHHENVVRYFNAWIESITATEDMGDMDASESSKSSVTNDNSVTNFVINKAPKKKGSLEDIVAKLGQEVKVEWSMSEGPVQKDVSSDSESDDDDDDEQDPWFNIMSQEEEEVSCGIEFENETEEKEPSEVDSPRPQSVRLRQVLYIQMEFCEKHTLRQAIDNGLYKDRFRVWRLFREIVEGLYHVHDMGMIHRDLKPVNIFLDSNNHVKLGDFGLATKAFTSVSVDDKSKPEDIGGSLTGQIGTALYVAPELVQAAGKVIYNQKVDIYSLGIILFEMFHPPLSTGMERVKVLTNLRSKEIVMPDAFVKDNMAKQIHVIKWLLNHDPCVRPTAAILLSSEHVPRPVNEGALSLFLPHALAERNSRGYQRLVTACLNQRSSPAEDLTYHSSMKPRPELLSEVRETVVKIFKSHGAIDYSPPLMLPRAKRWDKHNNAVKVMTSSGTVCHLPHDLRLPFARHVAYTGIKYMRRYVVERVYRERRVRVHDMGFHPRELVECAFDIVTPKTDNFWPDAELLVVASRAATAVGLKVKLQLNHTEMIRVLLLGCGVPDDKLSVLHPVLVDVSCGRITSFQLQTHLTSLCITNLDINNLLRLMEAEVPIHKARDLVTQVTRQSKLNKMVSPALQELEVVCRNAEALGCECPITVAPFLAYNAPQHSGVFWQMSVDKSGEKYAKRRTADLLAVGGRYDTLVEEFAEIARTSKDYDYSEFQLCSVGFSMSLERIATLLMKTQGGIIPPVKTPENLLISVCLSGPAGSTLEGQACARRAHLIRSLWTAGLRCCPWSASASEARESTRAAIVIEPVDDFVRVACWDVDSVREYKLPYSEVVDFIKQKVNPESVRSPEGSSNRSWSESDKTPFVSVSFITDDRLSKNSRRHIEAQISSAVSSSLSWLGTRARVAVLALALCAGAVRALAVALTAPLSPPALAPAFRLVEQLFVKNRDILDEALTVLTNMVKQNSQNKNNDEIQLYALYSIPDNVLKLIT